MTFDKAGMKEMWTYGLPLIVAMPFPNNQLEEEMVEQNHALVLIAQNLKEIGDAINLEHLHINQELASVHCWASMLVAFGCQAHRLIQYFVEYSWNFWKRRISSFIREFAAEWRHRTWMRPIQGGSLWTRSILFTFRTIFSFRRVIPIESVFASTVVVFIIFWNSW